MFRGAGHWDVVAEYHKESPNDVLIKVTIVNRGEQAATLHVIPQAWFRNTWSWGREGEGTPENAVWPARCFPPEFPLTLCADYLQDAPTMEREPGRDGMESVRCVHPVLGEFLFRAEAKTSDSPKPLFTNNETNHERLFGTPLEGAYVKDAFHRYVVGGDLEAINPSLTGTKVGMHYKVTVEAGASDTFCLRLTLKEEEADVAAVFGDAFDKVCKSRKREADRFFRSRQHDSLSSELRLIQRQVSLQPAPPPPPSCQGRCSGFSDR